MKVHVFLLLLFSFLLSCQKPAAPKPTSVTLKINVSKVKIGDSAADVRSIMGEASDVRSVKGLNVWTYLEKQENLTNGDQLMAVEIVFESGKVIRIDPVLGTRISK